MLSAERSVGDTPLRTEHSALSTPGLPHPRARLRELGRHARKRLSQSFLADQRVARSIVAAARLDPESDEVLEVGPGLGVLTQWLVQQARRVVAVELDPGLAAGLPEAVPATNLEVHQADILRFDPAPVFRDSFVVVANLPYHITSPALRHLLAIGPPSASLLVVMIQREVAQRITAGPGQLSALAVLLQAQARIEVVRHVAPGAFHPRPKVTSTVLRLFPLPVPERLVPPERLPEFERLLHAGFAQPRKRLANSLAQGLATPKSEAVALLEAANIDPNHRPQELTLPDWVRLFEQVAVSPSPREERGAGG